LNVLTQGYVIMSLSNKILIILVVTVAVCAVSLIIYKQFEMSERQKAIETEVVKQKELSDNITRSLNEYATKKDIEVFAKNNGVDINVIRNDMDKLHAEIKAINVITVTSGGVKKDNVPSTGTGPINPNPQTPTVDCNGKQIPCPNADPNGYLTARRDLTLSEQFGSFAVPIGTVGFSAWKKEPWFVNILPRQYKVATITGIDENQREYVYNKFSIIVDGRSYDLRIDKTETKQEYPSASFQFWNPRLFLTSGGGINLNTSSIQGTFNTGITLGMMSYGQYKPNPNISILQLGLGYEVVSKRFVMIINPINFNMSKLFSSGLIRNTYLGPSIQVDYTGNFMVGSNLSMGF